MAERFPLPGDIGDVATRSPSTPCAFTASVRHRVTSAESTPLRLAGVARLGAPVDLSDRFSA
jgi:hypothetical protein